MISQQEREQISKEFFQRAITKNLIVFKTPMQFSRKTKRIMNNTQSSAFTFVDFKKIYDDPVRLEEFCNNNRIQFGIEEIHSKILIKNFFTYHALNYLESNKLFFLEILRNGVKIGTRRKKIGAKMELGTMVVSLCQELNYDDFARLFPNEFRNILGHSAWWWAGDSITYEANGEQSMSLERLDEIMKEFSDNMNELIAEYGRRLTA